MKDDTSSDYSKELEDFSRPFLDRVRDKHALVARKMSLAIEQLRTAQSVEEYQQVGILVRDAWVEFVQKLYNSTTRDGGKPSLKDQIAFILTKWGDFPKELAEVCDSLIDLSNKIQHKTTIDSHSVKWCVLTTIFTMSMMLDLDAEHDRLSDRRYYKCPKCGSLSISCKKDVEVSYDGPGPEYEIWRCDECDWEHFLYVT